MAPDERCTPHGLWNCTACAPPGPTLAEMVERLRDPHTLDRFGVVADMAAEIDRRLTALEASKWEGLFRLHDRALLRAAIANSDAPQICDAYEPADRPGYDACARCGWSSRIHDGPTTIAQLLDGASPAAHAIVKSAFLEAAREHAPEWAPLLEADEDG